MNKVLFGLGVKFYPHTHELTKDGHPSKVLCVLSSTVFNGVIERPKTRSIVNYMLEKGEDDERTIQRHRTNQKKLGQVC